MRPNMAWCIVVLVWLVFVSAVKTQQDDSGVVDFKFDCQRSGMSCENNSTCSEEGGSCLCTDEYTGPDCTVKQTSESTACSPACYNGGECYTDEATQDTFCLCPDGYTGRHCQQHTVYHECYFDRITAYITPPVGQGGQFGGAIYVLDQEDDNNCVFSSNDSISYKGDLYFDQCGGALNVTEANGDETLYFTVVVRYSAILTERDQEFNFRCRLAPPGGNVSWNLQPLANDKKDRNLDRKDVTKSLVPLSLRLVDVDGKPITAAQKLGNKVTLELTLNAGTVYDSFRVQEIVVSNGMVGTKRHAIVLIYNGCVTKEAFKNTKIVTDFRGDPRTKVSLTFKVFKLKFTNELVFENTVKLCKNSTDCQQTTCGKVSLPGLGRRRRAADVSNDDLERVDTRITVFHPNDDRNFLVINAATEEQSRPSEFVQCMNSVGFIILIIALLLLLLLLVAIFALFFVRVLQERRSRERADNKAYTD